MTRKYTIRSKEKKLSIVKQVPAGTSAHIWEPEIDPRLVGCCRKKYQSERETGLEPKEKPGNPLALYEQRKELTYEEPPTPTPIELCKRELLKKEAEIVYLKQ